MGHVFAELELSNPRRPDFVPVQVSALVDTGALMLCIPEHVARQLDLETESVREVSVADGRTATVPYVGPLKVAFGKRFCYVGALVIGDEVLLGSVPMEDMDLVVNPGRRQLTVDPASPNVPHARVKRHATTPATVTGTGVGDVYVVDHDYTQFVDSFEARIGGHQMIGADPQGRGEYHGVAE